MPVIKAVLTGHAIDLDTLMRLFPVGDTRVDRDGSNGYYLVFGAQSDLMNDGDGLRDTAAEILRRINGATRVLDNVFRPVELSGTFIDQEQRHRHVIVVDSVEMRTSVSPVTVVQDCVPQSPPPYAGPGYVAAAEAHPDVDEVLTFMAMPGSDLSWIELYKIFEIVRASVGNEYELDRQGLGTRSEITAFRVSANHPSISGEDARHARLNAGQPKRTMTLPEGREFIRRLVRGWLDGLA